MHYTMKETAEHLNIAQSTLRYYEKEGLLPFQKRTASGIRYYTQDDICWLELICCLKQSGMSIECIRRFMLCCLKGAEGCEERKKLLLQHKEYILQQMKELQSALCLIDYKLEHYKEIGIFHIDY